MTISGRTSACRARNASPASVARSAYRCVEYPSSSMCSSVVRVVCTGVRPEAPPAPATSLTRSGVHRVRPRWEASDRDPVALRTLSVSVVSQVVEAGRSEVASACSRCPNRARTSAGASR
ncbi:hypothetical protein CJI59_02860 [Streptomyces sp. Alain-F2R5]|nr:hypothetical protein CJI59_02860 [Streptomyces sp. Alain-F2R5]